MRDFANGKPSVLKIILCSLLALFLGLIQPLAAIFQVMMPTPAICLAAMIAVALYVTAGIIPTAILGVVGAASSMIFIDLVPGAISTLLWIPPAVFIIIGIQKRTPFFRQMSAGILFTVGMTVLALIAMGLIYRGDMIGAAVEQLRQSFESQQELLWEAFEPLLKASGVSATKDDFLQSYYNMFRALQAYYELYLLGNMLSGAILTAGLSVLWGNWLCARKGLATTESYRDPTQWFLPSNVTYGLLILLAGGFIYQAIGGINAATLWIAVQLITIIVFMVQGLAAFSRRLKMGGAEGRQRTLILVLLIIAVNMLNLNLFVAIAGAASALFGSHGALRQRIDKMKNNPNE